MQTLQFGTRVSPMTIRRVNCADGVKSRAVLLDPNPRVKYIAWDDVLKRKVDCDQDLMVKYGLKPYTAILFLVVRLNTDMKGNVIDDSTVIEYLQLSESIYNEFSDLCEEMGSGNSIAFSKVSKQGPNGQDFSRLNVKPSNIELSKVLMDKIDVLKSNTQALDSLWAMVDVATSISKQQYLALKESSSEDSFMVASQSQQPLLKDKSSNPKKIVDSQSLSKSIVQSSVQPTIQVDSHSVTPIQPGTDTGLPEIDDSFDNIDDDFA